MNTPRRVVPVGSAYVESRMGVETQRERELARKRQGKTQDAPERRAIYYPTQTIRFVRDEVTSSGEQVLRLSDSSTMQFATSIRYPFGAAGWIIGATIVTDVARSAGSATVLLRISVGGGTETTYTITDAAVDGATVDGHVRDLSAAWCTPVRNGIAVAKGEAMRCSVFFAGFSPDLSDWLVDVVVALNGLS